MSRAGLRISGAILALALSAQANAAVPDFSPNAATAWISLRGQFRSPPSGPGPVMQDPRYPYVNGNDLRATGRQPTFGVGDLSNPILQDWARDRVRQRNERVLSGKPSFSRAASCWPVGVPCIPALWRAARVLHSESRQSRDDLADRSSGAAHLSAGAAFGGMSNRPGSANRSVITKATRWWWTPSASIPAPSSIVSRLRIRTNCMWSSGFT
jgi:hypothetical protein